MKVKAGGTIPQQEAANISKAKVFSNKGFWQNFPHDIRPNSTSDFCSRRVGIELSCADSTPALHRLLLCLCALGQDV